MPRNPLAAGGVFEPDPNNALSIGIDGSTPDSAQSDRQDTLDSPQNWIGAATAPQQPSWLDHLWQLIRGGFGGGQAGGGGFGGSANMLSGGGIKDLGNGMFHVPGTGVMRNRAGNVVPNVAMRGGDGRLYVNPPGYDLQFMDQLTRNMPPNDNSGIRSSNLIGYKAGTYDIPGVGKVTISPEAAAHAVVHVNDPGTSQFNWAGYAVDPRLAHPNEPNLMPGAHTTAQNYNAAVNWYKSNPQAWWTVPQGENYLHTPGYRPGWAADTN